MEAGEGANEGDKEGGKRGRKGCIVAGEGEISGEGKGQFRPFSGVVKREKRGGKGAKKLYLAEG